MADTLILVMRHAEKPDDADDVHLAPAGTVRAQRLATWLPAEFGTPDFIFASAESRHSDRPRETMQPLADACARVLETPYADADFAAQAHLLRTDPRYGGKLSLICWHHGEIPGLLQALGAPDGNFPDPWDPEVFNLIVRLRISADGEFHTDEITEPF
ncbi:hypothetical protein [Sphingomonas sp.]|uniref:hypothetical protein n=1 Tax=Sphingomonas sp. TaxID=28214 RepID=UPI0025FAA9F3|nr:hypothetical protein [Sphingomonas sp.]MBV9528622.1 histidine phosphatase family protein [Sphingomonas sp.]MBV9841710.1 histidine phosphatase family protein [Sphingomonadaceae bacterium]